MIRSCDNSCVNSSEQNGLVRCRRIGLMALAPMMALLLLCLPARTESLWSNSSDLLFSSYEESAGRILLAQNETPFTATPTSSSTAMQPEDTATPTSSPTSAGPLFTPTSTNSPTVTSTFTATLTPTDTLTPTVTPTATDTPVFEAPALIAPQNNAFFLIDEYNTTADLHVWQDVGATAYRLIRRRLSDDSEMVFEVDKTSLGAGDSPDYALSEEDVGRHSWRVAGLQGSVEGDFSEERFFEVGLQTPTPTSTATETPLPGVTEIAGSMLLDRDLVIAPHEKLIFESGSEIIIQSLTDLDNQGMDADRVEIIVEGALQVEGNTGGNLPVVFRPATPVPSPPTPVATIPPPTPPVYAMIHDSTPTDLTNLAPKLTDFDGDGLAERIYYGESEGRLFVADYLGLGNFGPISEVYKAVGRAVGDFNESGCTDQVDYNFMLENWGIPIDGVPIGLTDYFNVMDNYLKAPGCFAQPGEAMSLSSVEISQVTPSFTLNPPSAAVGMNDVVRVTVEVNTEGRLVRSIAAVIEFDPAVFEVVGGLAGIDFLSGSFVPGPDQSLEDGRLQITLQTPTLSPTAFAGGVVAFDLRLIQATLGSEVSFVPDLTRFSPRVEPLMLNGAIYGTLPATNTPTPTETLTPTITPGGPTLPPTSTPTETPTEGPTFTSTATPTPTNTPVASNMGSEEIDIGTQSIPCFADGDGDGVLDMFIGGGDGRIRVFENIAAANSEPPMFKQIRDPNGDFAYLRRIVKADEEAEPPVPKQYEVIEIEEGAAPALGDLNGDGLLDLLVGNHSGQMVYYEGTIDEEAGASEIGREFFFNESTFVNRLFKPVLDDELSLMIQVAEAGVVIPEISDYDDDGDLDIFAGRQDGFLKLWESRLAQGEYLFPALEFPQFDYPIFPRLIFYDLDEGFVLENIGPDEFVPLEAPGRTAPTLGRLEPDNDPILLLGSDTGRIRQYENIFPFFDPIEQLFDDMSVGFGLAELDKGLMQEDPGQTPGLNPSAEWGGIWFKDNSRDDLSVIENAIIQGARVGVRMDGASPKLREVSILNSTQYGVIADNQSYPTIEESNISSHALDSVAGLMVDNQSAPTLENVRIIDNGRNGVLIRRNSFPLLRGTGPGKYSVIAENQFGIRIETGSLPRLGNVSNSRTDDNGLIEFYDNVFYDIYNDTTSQIKAENNVWRTSDFSDIDARIYDDNENPERGVVDFIPLARLTPLDEPTPTPTATQEYIEYPVDTPTPEPIEVTEVSGVIDQATVWEGVVLLTDDVTVSNGVVLEIKPGTLIRFREQEPKIQFKAENSTILARGSRVDPIYFVPENYDPHSAEPQIDNKPFAGIALEGPGFMQSEFRYSEIHFASLGLQLTDNNALVENTEFVSNGWAMRVEHTGAYDPERTAARVRGCVFMNNGGSVQVAGDSTADFGTENSPGMNSFVFPSASPARFEFEVASYTLPEPIAFQRNYFIVRDNSDGARLDTYAELQPRFQPGTLYDEDLNPAGQFNAFPTGAFLQDDMNGREGIQILHPEVWAGQVEIGEDVEIFSQVMILPGAEIEFATGEIRHEIQVLAGTIYLTDTRRFVLDGSLWARGSSALPIKFRSIGGERGSWLGLRFSGQSTRYQSMLQYCNIDDAVNGVTLEGATIHIEDCQIDNFLESGIDIKDQLPLDQRRFEFYHGR